MGAILIEVNGAARFLAPEYPYAVPGIDEGIYPSFSHAFAAARTLIPEDRERIQGALNGGVATRMGRHVELRPNWSGIAPQIEKVLLVGKFRRNPEALRCLINTGSCTLLRSNGEEWKELMEVREKLKEEKT